MARPAGSSKTKATESVGVETEVKEQKPVDNETEFLRKQVEEQKKQMEELMEKIKILSSAVTPVNEVPVKKDNEKKYITFVNMVKGGMNLKGTRFYHIDKQFGSRKVLESEARVIINNMPNTIQSGLVYITDREFIEENGLDDYYDTIIDDKTLKTLLDKSADEVIRIYNEANVEQKKIILDMVVSKKLDGERIDANIVQELGRLCGKDLMGIDPLEEDGA